MKLFFIIFLLISTYSFVNAAEEELLAPLPNANAESMNSLDINNSFITKFEYG